MVVDGAAHSGCAWMLQLLYKYLPEPMRNPQTFEWMLSNPEYRKQLEGMMQQQVRWLCLLAEARRPS